ncbi:hypothetical protein G0R31_004480 [Salmonella enterica]|nr:hypothetical protein [Salmonella enterica]
MWHNCRICQDSGSIPERNRKTIWRCILGRQSFLHGSETLRIHRQINNDAACGRFGDFALR